MKMSHAEGESNEPNQIRNFYASYSYFLNNFRNKTTSSNVCLHPPTNFTSLWNIIIKKCNFKNSSHKNYQQKCNSNINQKLNWIYIDTIQAMKHGHRTHDPTLVIIWKINKLNICVGATEDTSNSTTTQARESEELPHQTPPRQRVEWIQSHQHLNKTKEKKNNHNQLHSNKHLNQKPEQKKQQQTSTKRI